MAGRPNRSGRKRTPTNAKLIRGTFRSDRHAREPQVPLSWPQPPAFLELTEQQRVIWDGLRVHSQWHAASDWPSVWILVAAIDGLVANHRAQRLSEAEGTPDSKLKTAELRHLDRIYRFAALNGFTPVDRARMPQAGEIDVVNPLARFLRKVD